MFVFLRCLFVPAFCSIELLFLFGLVYFIVGDWLIGQLVDCWLMDWLFRFVIGFGVFVPVLLGWMLLSVCCFCVVFLHVCLDVGGWKSDVGCCLLNGGVG